MTLRRREVVKELLRERKDLLVIAGLGSTAWDVTAAGDAQTVAAHVHTAIGLAYETQGAQAVLIAQRVIGIKSFQEQTDQ